MKNTLFSTKNYKKFSKFLKNSGLTNSNNSSKMTPNDAYDYTKHSLLNNLYMFGYNKDNIGYILHEPQTKTLIGIDFGEFTQSKSIVDKLETKFTSKLKYILTTHAHHDHSGGNKEWKTERGNDLEICSGSTEGESIPYANDKLFNNLETLTIGEYCIACMHTPGHTKSHVCYLITHVAENSTRVPILFCGDTLFIGGCGRVFNGTYEELHNSLKQITYLPNDTLLFPGHEYTQRNLEFCMKLDPNNDFLLNKYEWVKDMREKNEFTVGSRLIEERLYNPFLRCSDDYYLELTDEVDPVKVFTKIRMLKDKF